MTEQQVEDLLASKIRELVRGAMRHGAASTTLDVDAKPLIGVIVAIQPVLDALFETIRDTKSRSILLEHVRAGDRLRELAERKPASAAPAGPAPGDDPALE